MHNLLLSLILIPALGFSATSSSPEQSSILSLPEHNISSQRLQTQMQTQQKLEQQKIHLQQQQDARQLQQQNLQHQQKTQQQINRSAP